MTWHLEILRSKVRRVWKRFQEANLLEKLKSVGIRIMAWKLFQSYLLTRTEIVKNKNFTCDELRITYGVRQGSILGPSLLLVFIHDLCQSKLPSSDIFCGRHDTIVLS